MTVTIELTDEMEERLREAAADRGQDASELLHEILLDVLGRVALLPHRKHGKLVPSPSSQRARVAGLNKGEVWMSEDFDAPFPDAFWAGSE